MEIEKLSEWNPWWEKTELIKELEGKPRPAYNLLINSTQIKEITIITGVRRAGKSTLMYQMISSLLKKGVSPEQILFVNLEDKKLSNNSLEEIYQSYKENINPNKKAYVFFDEIHRKKDWESWIRKEYDTQKDKFIISGSCSYLLKKEYSTLLTGRNLSFEVFPLIFKEFLLFNNIELPKKIILNETKFKIQKNLKEFLNMGGFPEAIMKQEPYKIKILEQYLDDIIYKDIIDRYNPNSKKIKDLALFLITNFTSTISLRNLRNALNISYDTIKDYLSYFEEAFLFSQLDFFSYPLKDQKTMPSKIYCIDNGLRNAVSFKFSKDEGKLAENLTFIELKRKDKNIYYWKNPQHKEVDFVIKNKNQTLSAINVSFANEINEREIKGLIDFKKQFKKCKEMLILTKSTEKTEKGIKFIPLWKWLLADN